VDRTRVILWGPLAIPKVERFEIRKMSEKKKIKKEKIQYQVYREQIRAFQRPNDCFLDRLLGIFQTANVAPSDFLWSLKNFRENGFDHLWFHLRQPFVKHHLFHLC
jgi:hypothetical protein